MTKKYELTDESIEHYGRTLYRIKALKDFNDVKIGELGGFIEKEDNLSQENDCWVYDDVKVFDNARVYNDAKICDNAKIFGDAKVYGDAKVWGNTIIYDGVEVFDNAKICDNAKVFGNAKVYGDAKVCSNAKIYDGVEVFDNAKISDNARIYDDAKVYGDAEVFGNTELLNHAFISKTSDYISIISIGSENGILTAFKLEDNSIYISRGCFKGTLEEFSKAVKKTHGDNHYAKGYMLAIELIKHQLLSF